MGRRCFAVGQRRLGAPSRRRKGCALCRHPSGVEKRTTWAAAFCLGSRIFRLEDDTHSVTLTVRCGQLRQGTSHFPQSLGTDEVEGSRMSIQVTCPLLAGNGPAPCSNTTIKKLHEFFDHAGKGEAFQYAFHSYAFLAKVLSTAPGTFTLAWRTCRPGRRR